MQLRKLFEEGSLRVLCATTSLAVGVNLPAHLVVVMGTKRWRGASRGYGTYTRATMLQVQLTHCTRSAALPRMKLTR